MNRLIALLFLIAGTIHAAGPVQVAFDAAVVSWNNRCIVNNPYAATTGVALNKTHSLIASSVWMGGVRAAGLYPGNILRANLMCGGSYGGTNGCGDSSSVGSYNIGSPQIPLINDTGGAMDTCLNVSPINSLQYRWKYTETGSGGGLGCVSSANYVAFDTGVNANAVSAWQNDAHGCMYMITGGAEAAYLMGASDVTSTNAFYFIASYTGFGQQSGIWSYVGQPTTADTVGTGLYLGSRTSSATNGVTQYRNGVSTASSSSVGGLASNLSIPVYIFVFNYAAVPTGPTSHLSGGYGIGRGLTAAQVTNYYGAWQQFETLLGRQK